MTTQAAVTLTDAEPIELRRTTVDRYCGAVRDAQCSEFWWYMIGLVNQRSRRKPFQDGEGRWWWHVKPGFVWPVDYLTPIARASEAPPGRLLLGWQYPVGEAEANSRVHLNVIHDLSGYDLDRIGHKKRRNTIRKALRELAIAPADPADRAFSAEACEVWNSHVRRTGWNTPMSVEEFQATWMELASCPGTTVLAAREQAEGGALCAWLIARVIDDTVFIDTLTSHTDRLASSPNDGLVFLCLLSAARLGVRHAHYALKSKVETLEAFKQGLGFVPHPFASRLRLRFPVGPLLRMFKPAIYKRLLGDESWSA